MHSFKNVFHYKFKGLSKMASNICDKIAQFGRGRKKWCRFDQNSFQPTLNPRMLQIRECFNENVATSAFQIAVTNHLSIISSKRGDVLWAPYFEDLCWLSAGLTASWSVRKQCTKVGCVAEAAAHFSWRATERSKWLCVQFWFVVFPQWSQFLAMGSTFLMISLLLIATQNMEQVFQSWLIVGHQHIYLTLEHLRADSRALLWTCWG